MSNKLPFEFRDAARFAPVTAQSKPLILTIVSGVIVGLAIAWLLW